MRVVEDPHGLNRAPMLREHHQRIALQYASIRDEPSSEPHAGAERARVFHHPSHPQA
jgi:hypothetical protein